MSSTTANTNPNDTTSAGRPRHTLDKGVLQVPAAAAGDHGLEYSLLQYHGNRLDDYPFYFEFAQRVQDRRKLPRLSVRFKSKAQLPQQTGMTNNASRQAEVRTAVWSAYKSLVTHKSDASGLPKVVFDSMDGFETITVIFTSIAAFEAFANNVKAINLDSDAQSKRNHVQDAMTNTLSGDILVFECLGLPMDTIEEAELFASLKTMVSGLGSLESLADVVATSENGEISVEAGILRCYVKLARANLAIDYARLLGNMPTHFKWYGIAYTLIWPRHDHPNYVNHSADYPHSKASSSNAADTASAAKKQRTGA